MTSEPTVRPCVFCGGKVVAGFAELHASWAETLFWGSAPSFLVFVGGDTFELELLAPAQRNESLTCSGCGGTVISGTPWTP